MSGPGALRRWREEVRAGRRDNRNVSDALHLAACWEKSGDEAAAMGWDQAAADDYAEARQIMVEARLAVDASKAVETAAAAPIPVPLPRRRGARLPS